MRLYKVKRNVFLIHFLSQLEEQKLLYMKALSVADSPRAAIFDIVSHIMVEAVLLYQSFYVKFIPKKSGFYPEGADIVSGECDAGDAL